MKKHIVIILLLLIAIGAKAQIVSTNNNNNIILTQIDSTNQSRFCLVEKGSVYAKYVNLPAQYKVNDFSILNDTVYFCGQENMGNRSTRGFIGYISKKDLFIASKKHAFTFTPLNITTCDDDSCFTIRKIKTYHNNLGERIVVGIGRIYYGEVDIDYDKKPQKASESNKNLRSFSKYYYDCLMVYKVTEEKLVSNQQAVNHSFADSTYAKGNKVYFYRNINSLNSKIKHSAEIIEDITLTNNFICVVSVIDNRNIEDNDPSSFYNNIIIRRFDKNDFNQVSNRIDLSKLVYGVTLSGVKVEHIGNNKIALAYALIAGKGVKIYTTKINLETPFYNIIHTSFVDSSDINSTILTNLEYMSKQDTLLLQKKSYINKNITNKSYYLNMRDKVEPNSIAITATDTATNLSQCSFPLWKHFTNKGQLYVVHLGTNIYNAILKYVDLSIVAQGKVYNSCIYQR